MKLWEVRGSRPALSREDTLYVMAPSEPHARNFASLHGLKVDTVRSVLPSELPPDAEVLSTTREGESDALSIIAASPLIRSPILTIAFSVALGILLGSCIFAIIANGLGGSMRIGR